jgi:group I intron endonuclease
MQKFGFVYKWINIKSRKWYIGSHFGGIDDGYIGSGKVFLKAYKKHQPLFIRHIIYAGDDFRQVEESMLISFNAQLNEMSYNLKNSAIGGDTSHFFTEESRKRMASSGLKNKGRKVPEEQKQKIREKLLGRKASEELKKRKSIAMMGEKNHFYGKKHSAETIKKLSQKCGRKLSDAQKERLHESNRKKIYSQTDNIYFNSISECAKHYGHSAPYTSNMIAGRSTNKYGLVVIKNANAPKQ